MSNKQLKLMTLDEAVSRIEDGMTVGIGTGSTVELLVPKIAGLIHEKGYQLIGVYIRTHRKSSKIIEHSNCTY